MSAAWAAAIPYFPLIPIPTDADVSIATSFAPSPIANTRPFFDISLTIAAFYFGVHLAKTRSCSDSY